MAPRKSAARAALKPWDYGTPVIQPFAKSLDGQPPFLGNQDFVRNQNNATNVERFEGLLASAQKACNVSSRSRSLSGTRRRSKTRITDLDLARDVLEQTHEPRSEVRDWDEARVWREMYLREYEVSDKLRQIAQNLDDKFGEAGEDVDDHNNVLDSLSDAARRLELDLGL